MRHGPWLTRTSQRSLFTRASRQQVPVARTFLTSAVRRGMFLPSLRRALYDIYSLLHLDGTSYPIVR